MYSNQVNWISSLPETGNSNISAKLVVVSESAPPRPIYMKCMGYFFRAGHLGLTGKRYLLGIVHIHVENGIEKWPLYWTIDAEAFTPINLESIPVFPGTWKPIPFQQNQCSLQWKIFWSNWYSHEIFFTIRLLWKLKIRLEPNSIQSEKSFKIQC